MPYLLEGENIVEKKKCRFSGEEFFITDKDLAFYDQISPVYSDVKYPIPSPTLSPSERMRRRLAFRNERKLYHRKCDATGKQLISNYHQNTIFPVYHRDYWQSDAYNPSAFGMAVNFDEPFFTQFARLSEKVPRFHTQQQNPIENSQYANYVSNAKNCYLVFDADYNEDCMYLNVGSQCKDCLDGSILAQCEHCFECVKCDECHGCMFCSNSVNCSDCWFLDECIGCRDCAFSCNLRNKQYVFQNQQLTKEQYIAKIEKIKQDDEIRKVRSHFEKYKATYPKKYLTGVQVENCTGDQLFFCKNVKHSFTMNDCEDCAYCDFMIHTKNSYDCSSFGETSAWNYECCTVGHRSQNCLFDVSAVIQSANVLYTQISYGAKNCFGCASVKQGCEYMLLNTPMGKQEYNASVAKLIDHMRSTGEWGEFFPIELSVFGYNETLAQEYFPMSKQEVQALGWNWKDEDETSSYHGDIYQPLAIGQYDESKIGEEKARANIESCLEGILSCEVTGKPFKITRQELAFYLEKGLPLPRRCPDQRHKDRLTIRNPRKLFDRHCAACQKDIVTPYAPDRSEEVLCEECYQKTVY